MATCTGADEAVAYLRRKAPYLDYVTALVNGWQIATGDHRVRGKIHDHSLN